MSRARLALPELSASSTVNSRPALCASAPTSAVPAPVLIIGASVATRWDRRLARTPTGRYLGAVHIQRLLREPPSMLAAGLVDSSITPLAPSADVAHVSRYFATYDLVCAPVVNDKGMLVGAVTVDDVLDHLLPDDWRHADDESGGAL